MQTPGKKRPRISLDSPSPRKKAKPMMFIPSPTKPRSGKNSDAISGHRNRRPPPERSGMVRTNLALEGLGKEMPEVTGRRSFSTSYGLNIYLQDESNGWRRREDFGRVAGDIEVYDQINPREEEHNGAKRLVILALNNALFIKRSKAGQHNSFVSPSHWARKLSLELGADCFILFIRGSDGLLDIAYHGLFSLQNMQDYLEPSDWACIDQKKTQGIKALWAKMHEHDEDQCMGPESEPDTVKKFPSFMLTCHGFDAKFHEQLQRHDSSSMCARNPKDVYKEAHPGRDRPWHKTRRTP